MRDNYRKTIDKEQESLISPSIMLSKSRITSDKFITRGKDPAIQEPINITRDNIHNTELSSIFLKLPFLFFFLNK